MSYDLTYSEAIDLIETLRERIASDETAIAAARAVTCEEAARKLLTRVHLFREIDVTMTRSEEREHFAAEIRALALLPPALVVLKREDVEKVRAANEHHGQLDCCCEVHTAALALLEEVKP